MEGGKEGRREGRKRRKRGEGHQKKKGNKVVVEGGKEGGPRPFQVLPSRQTCYFWTILYYSYLLFFNLFSDLPYSVADTMFLIGARGRRQMGVVEGGGK